MEKQIYLEGIDPLEFYGVANNNIELIKKYFPKIIITARGNSVIVKGAENELKHFEKKFALLLDHFYQFNLLNEENIRELLNSGISVFEENEGSEPDIILFGNSGRPVRARTPN